MFDSNETSLPELPESKTVKNAILHIFQNGGDFRVASKLLLLSENNLSDGNATEMRKNLDVYSKEDVDEAIKKLSESIALKLTSRDEEINNRFKTIEDDLSSTIKQLSKGSVLIGELVEWPLAKMPQEIWTDLGMVFIPYNGQTFDGTTYPDLAKVHPGLKLPIDMRGEMVRGWDNSRGLDSGRALLSVQNPTYLRTGMTGFNGEEYANGSQVRVGLAYANEESSTLRNIEPPTGTYTHPNGKQFNSGGPFDNDPAATTGGTSHDNAITGQIINGGYDTLTTSIGKTINWISLRPRNIAWNYIVRAK